MTSPEKLVTQNHHTQVFNELQDKNLWEQKWYIQNTRIIDRTLPLSCGVNQKSVTYYPHFVDMTNFFYRDASITRCLIDLIILFASRWSECYFGNLTCTIWISLNFFCSPLSRTLYIRKRFICKTYYEKTCEPFVSYRIINKKQRHMHDYIWLSDRFNYRRPDSSVNW